MLTWKANCGTVPYLETHPAEFAVHIAERFYVLREISALTEQFLMSEGLRLEGRACIQGHTYRQNAASCGTRNLTSSKS